MTAEFKKTVHLKVKPEAYAWLTQAAVEVNQVWNYCNETSQKALETGTERPAAKWLSGFDLCYLTAGMTEFMRKIGADSIQNTCTEYAQRRRQFQKRRLRWRVSRGAKRSLGWVPFKASSLKLKGNALRFCGKTFRVFDLQRLLEYGTRKSGSFSQNSLGEWFLNVVVELPEQAVVPTGKHIGIDLGMKTTATCSDGAKLEAAQFYRSAEQKLASAQRRGHKKQAKRIYLKVKNRRMDSLHKFSRKWVDENDVIVIGDVSPSGLAKTRMAKSVLDAGWASLKTFLQYKGAYAGRKVEVVNEAFTTRACSNCGCVSGPKGLRQLVVREWVCSECKAEHDRDVHSARNILALALRPGRPLAGTRQDAEARRDRAEAA